jgi:hypothetical protein
MSDTFNPSQASDALARDVTELRDRVLNDPATKAVALIAAAVTTITVVSMVATVTRSAFRRRRLIGKILLAVSVATTVNQLRDTLGDHLNIPGLTRNNDGPPPPPPAT